jgi:hypothetical protein
MNSVKKILLISSLGCLMIACGPKASDQDLTTAIQAKLYANDATRSANVKVAVADGVVTLTGGVPTSDVALQAMNVANGTPGIKSVNNQLTVDTAASTAAPLPPAVAPPQNLAPPPRREEPVRHDGDRDRDRARDRDRDHDRDRDRGGPPLPPPPPIMVTIPAGQSVSVRMIDGIDTGHNQQGQTFRASLSAPITDGDRVIVPAGAPATVLLAETRGAGRIKGQSELELRLTSIGYHGADVAVSSGAYEAQGSGRGKQTAIRTGIGAAAGALIGGLAGGGKGAGIGAAAGGGAGIGFQLLTHGQQIKIPSETEITFRLAAPLVLAR